MIAVLQFVIAQIMFFIQSEPNVDDAILLAIEIRRFRHDIILIIELLILRMVAFISHGAKISILGTVCHPLFELLDKGSF